MGSVGARGVISVLSNMDPRYVKAYVDPIIKQNDFVAARKAHYKYFTFTKKLGSLGVNPEPVKAAMHLMGLLPSAAVRQPLWGIGDANTKILREAMVEAGFI